jgi:uncharacterized protein YndB with AHSA1/START domain
MKNEPIVIERTLHAPVAKVWQAITDNNEMKKWYFNLPEFKPEVGFEFRFDGGTDDRIYHHVCVITEVIPGKKLQHSWRYDGYEGISYVTFELFAEGDKTRVRLTHEGIEAIAVNGPDFYKENFMAGWTDIIGRSLKEFAEKGN